MKSYAKKLAEQIRFKTRVGDGWYNTGEVARDRICVVTGATGKIGNALCKKLAGFGAEMVVMVCRNQEKGEDIRKEIIGNTRNPNVQVMRCDLLSSDSIKEFADKFAERFNRLDILINNAGLTPSRYRFQEPRENVRLNMWLTHCVATFLLTKELEQIILTSDNPKIINITSTAHRHAKAPWFGDLAGLETHRSIEEAYAHSKLCLNLITLANAIELGDRAQVNCVHPGEVFKAQNLPQSLKTIGYLASPLVGLVTLTPDEAASGIIEVATRKETGRYFKYGWPTLPSTASQNTADAIKLWKHLIDKYLLI